jgi:hypothetical protein
LLAHRSHLHEKTAGAGFVDEADARFVEPEERVSA